MSDPPRGTPFDAAALLGKSMSMRAVQQALPCVARADLSLVLCGEVGTGKRQWAQALHEHSARQGRPFVAVRIAGNDENTLDAKLFGAGGRDGVFCRALRGTVYLDGIDALSPRLQHRLNQLLEGNPVDVRVISGTASTLPENVRFGRFSRALYGRLAVVQLTIAPLRERPEDIPVVVEHCLWHGSPSRPSSVVRDDALVELCRYGWPENTRELVQVLEATCALAKDRPISGELIRTVLGQRPRRNAAVGIVPLDQLEVEYILTALARCDGNQSMAARRLGIGRSTLIRKLRASGNGTVEAA